MPTSLALCLDAPMQSWGIRSRAIIRDTATEPTKSGVVGLLAAALGVQREDEATIARLAALRLAVRVDREGILERDFHTTQNVPTTLGGGRRTIVSERYYLADALFLVVLQGDPELLRAAAAAVRRPVWPLFLGRRAFVPARPLIRPEGESRVLTGSGIVAADAETVLAEHLWLESSRAVRAAELAKPARAGLRTIVDCDPRLADAEVRHDLPRSFAQHDRRYVTRTVRTATQNLTESMIPAGEFACS